MGGDDSQQNLFKNRFNRFDDQYDWVIELPGVAPGQVEVYTLANDLVVEVSEFREKMGPFKTSIILSDGDEIIHANCEDGVLTISIKRPFEREEVTVHFV
jgi:HSP20 family molecular chaperone IbpA